MHSLIYCTFVIVALISSVSATLLVDSDDLTQETQHAVCKIITEKGQTSANATVTRKLKGVCTFKQIESKFAKLEKKLIQELSKIQKVLGIMNQIETTEPYDDYALYEESDDEEPRIVSTINKRDDSSIIQGRLDTEILEFNDTISKVDNIGYVFTYYWCIKNISRVLSRSGIHIRSPDFYVLGHELCIQLYPNYLGTDFAGFQLRPSSNFIKKHKIIVLHLADTSKDQESETLGGTNSFGDIFQISNHLLLNNVIYDGIYVKISIFLDT